MSDQNGTVRIVDVGRAIPIVKGVWDAETAYEMLDIVSYEDYTYIAKANTEPGISPANMEYWLVLAGSVTSWGAIRGLLENQTDLQTALDAKLNAGDAGSMAAADDVQHDGLPYLRKDGEWINSDSRYYTESEADTLLAAKANAADLGTLADHDTVDYRTEVTHKPTLGALADHDKVNYETEITNLPTLGTMAAKDDAASDNKAYGRRNAAWYDLDGRYYTETEINTKLAEKAKNTLIAEAFVTSVTYNKGDYVVYNGNLYRFTATHPAGTWSGSDAAAVNVGDELESKTDAADLKEMAYIDDAASDGKAWIRKDGVWYDADGRYYTESEIDTKLNLKANLASPTFTGTPKAPTAAAGTNTTQIATTAFVAAGLDGKLDLHSTADLSGGVTPILLTNEDMNDLRPGNTTFYYATSGSNVSNLPTGIGTCGVLVMRVAGGLYVQICATASGAGQFYTRRYSSSGTWTQWQQLPLNFTAQAFHNSVYRGKNLGTEVTADQYDSISSGTFYDMYIGDYWVINGVNWRIAAFDYWYNIGDTKCTTHHVVIVPDTSLGGAKMNETATTEGAYIGSDFYTGNNNNTAKAEINVIIESAFGAAHILSHREYLANAVTDGYESATAWYDSTWELMSEVMVYGCEIFHNVAHGTNNPRSNASSKTQLPLFHFDHSKITISSHYWLRNVAYDKYFTMVANAGYSASTGAENSRVVRPVFGICA